MDGQDYLNRISADVRPAGAKAGGGGLLHSKFFIVIMAGVIGLLLIFVLGLALGGGTGGTSEKEKSIALLLHINGTADAVKEYQGSVKSSSLRSSSASLYGVLTNTSRALESYLTSKYSYKEKDITKKVKSKADEDKEALRNELFEAKINGLLDRTMARKMSYEISLLMSEESSVLKSAKNEELKNLLNESYGSLRNLYGSFNGFLEGQ